MSLRLSFLLLCGCAMSPVRLEALEASLAQRNDQSMNQARENLLRSEHLTDGYGPNWVTVLSIDCERTTEREFSLARRGDGSTERLTFPDGALARLCNDRQLVLDAMLEGKPVKARWWANPVSYARDARGALVSYTLKPRVVRRESALVKQSCDHMPPSRPPPPRFDVVVTSSLEPVEQHFERSYDTHELDVTCTENTH